jgi:hypothetical protein
MYKLVGDPSQIKLLTDGVPFLDTPYKISNLMKEYKIMREHTEECKLDKSILVKDLSLIVKGPEED